MSDTPSTPPPDSTKAVRLVLDWLVIVAVVVGLVYYFLPAIPDYFTGKSVRREKAIALYNSKADAYKSCEERWNAKSGSWKTMTKEEKLAYLRNCREPIERLQAFRPLGVDPGLASAISELRAASLAYFDFRQDEVDRGISDSKAEKALAERQRLAHTRVDSEMNRLAAELGGIRDPIESR
jgi:hypothetical protein